MLILGETGTGKSMFAKILHKFFESEVKGSAHCPFISFNCADYAHNPQLLIGQLFGIKKGAYTGSSEQKGMIELADKGILFLDEVHRLPKEGQEMLFTFIDQGKFRRLGETTNTRKADVLIIAATTEKPESYLLDTFTRRIPMVIKLPALRERTKKERYELILQFFKEEAKKIKKEIRVTTNVIKALLFYDCTQNVGQLKTDIQLVCARAYADFTTKNKETVTASTRDLPDYIKTGLLQAKNKTLSFLSSNGDYLFPPNEKQVQYQIEENEENTIYKKLEKTFQKLKAQGASEEEVELLINFDIKNYFKEYIKTVHRQVNKKELEKVIDPNILSLSEEVIDYVERKLNLKMDKKVWTGLALHIQTTRERLKRGRHIFHPELNRVRQKYNKEFQTAMECLKLIERRLEIELPIDEAGFLTMFFTLDQKEFQQEKESVSVILVMHGNQSATSMAQVANQLLGNEIVLAVDMPLEADPLPVYKKLKKMAANQVNAKGVLLLVDMGSLLQFEGWLEKDLMVPVKAVPLVSTLHVIEAARKAMLNYTLSDIYSSLEELKNPVQQYSTKTQQKNSKKLAIVTACTTGEGSALALKKFLDTHLSYNREIFEIVPLQISPDQTTIHWHEQLSDSYQILAVVTDFNISSQAPKFSLEDVLSLGAIHELQKMIDLEETYIKMTDVVKNHIHGLNAESLILDIRSCLEEIKKYTRRNIDPYDLIGLVLHLSCMIDRLRSGDSSVSYGEKKEALIQQHLELYNEIKHGLQPLETK